jgi:hypothetical protein
MDRVMAHLPLVLLPVITAVVVVMEDLQAVMIKG